jgi:MoxR-like ATPase
MRPTSVQGDFVFREGPIFTNFLLADELNRTSPKTQAALLEAMAEATVTVDGETHALPNPFFVVATQNPFEFHGVYPLPESQLDRFMMQLVVSHPLETEELAIYRRDVGRAKMVSELTLEDLAGLRSKVNQVFFEETVLEYCHKLVTATRSHARVKYGVSVRGALKFIRAAKSLAMIRGRDFVKPSDLQELAPFVLAHRLCMQDNGLTAQERQVVVQEILESTSSPK